MRIDFNELPAMTVPGMNGGAGEMTARMHVSERGKLIVSALHPGCSIGPHRHETSDDINYVLSGKGTAVCLGEAEPLSPGVWHICPKGGEHSIKNDGSEDLVPLTVVVER